MSLKMLCESCKKPCLKASMAHVPVGEPFGKLHLCRSCASKFYRDFCDVPPGSNPLPMLREVARMKGWECEIGKPEPITTPKRTRGRETEARHASEGEQAPTLDKGKEVS